MSRSKRRRVCLGFLPIGGVVLFLYLFIMGYAAKMPQELTAGLEGGVMSFFQMMLIWKKLTVAAAFVALVYCCGEAAGRIRNRRRFLVIWRILLLVGILAFALLGGRPLKRELSGIGQVRSMRQKLKANERIVHAGGQLIGEDGSVHRLTNSVEAMEHALAAGERVIELDVRMTKDGDMGCFHSGRFLYDVFGNQYDRHVTTEEFATSHTEGGYTPMTFRQVVEYMQKYPDLYIVLDIKIKWKRSLKKVTKLAKGVQDRLILQIPHEKYYDYAREMGYQNIIYTLYRISKNERRSEHLKEFLHTHLLVGVTFGEEKYEEDPELVELLEGSGEVLYTHTVDDEARIEELLGSGIDAVYTDLVREIQS